MIIADVILQCKLLVWYVISHKLPYFVTVCWCSGAGKFPSGWNFSWCLYLCFLCNWVCSQSEEPYCDISSRYEYWKTAVLLECFTSLCLHIHVGVHRLPNGVRTEYFEILESTGRNTLLPTTPDEFQYMIEMISYNPAPFSFHYRFREALISLQLPHYPHFKESKLTIVSIECSYWFS